MTQEISEDKNKKEKIKFPQLQYGIYGVCDIYTTQGKCTWSSPNIISLEENIKYLEFTISKFKDQIEFNKKQAEKEIEKNKPAAENKNSNYKSV